MYCCYSIWRYLYDLSLVQVGEGRACWSLGNAHSAMGDPEKAYHYASRHLEISKETGDRMGQATAQVQYTGITRRG